MIAAPPGSRGARRYRPRRGAGRPAADPQATSATTRGSSSTSGPDPSCWSARTAPARPTCSRRSRCWRPAAACGRARLSELDREGGAAPGRLEARVDGPLGPRPTSRARPPRTASRRVVECRRRAPAQPERARRHAEPGLADAGDGPPVPRGGLGPAALPRPARARDRPAPCRPTPRPTSALLRERSHLLRLRPPRRGLAPGAGATRWPRPAWRSRPRATSWCAT